MILFLLFDDVVEHMALVKGDEMIYHLPSKWKTTYIKFGAKNPTTIKFTMLLMRASICCLWNSLHQI